jgi:hypothetical protein
MKPRRSVAINIIILSDKATVERDMTTSCRASVSLQFVVMSSVIWRCDLASRMRTCKLVNRRRPL